MTIYLRPAPFIRVCGVACPAQADLHHPLAVQQPLLHASPERSPVANLLPQDHVAGVSVSIHVDETHGAVPDDHRIETVNKV